MVTRFFLLLLLLAAHINASSQNSKTIIIPGTNQDSSSTKEVEILHADKLEFNTLANGEQLRKLVGSVSLKHENTLMFCDSAYLYKETNKVDAWGHIHIQENDSINAYSDILYYDGKTKTAELVENARLEDGNKTLYSEILTYNIKDKIGSYNSGGKLIMDSTILTSTKAYYFTNSKIVHFKENVEINDPNYRLISDTLHYLTNTKVAKFYGPTTIFNDSSTIDCILGSYDTENEIASFGKGTIINNAPQKLIADSLYYERFRSYGKAFYYFDWIDLDMNAGMEGSEAEYYENNQEIIAYNRPLLKVSLEEDTLFLRGDTIHTLENEISGEKEFWSNDKVRIYKTDLQGVSDSLFFSYGDSMMRMYFDPLLWNDKNQMQGDTVFIQLANDKVKEVYFLENSFVSMQSKGKLFDQIKSKDITGYFTDNEMKRMLADKNAESLYFGKNDDEEYIGGNYAKSKQIMVYLEEKEVDHISFLENPEAIFTPMSQMTDAELYLKGFTWHSELRPKNKLDL